jgi:uncharacterized protein YdeI (YjbR/CyaY-like superfamily)
MTEPKVVVTASSPAEWRGWLAEHHDTATEAWLVIPHKNSGIPGPTHTEAVEQALCFGWIDGLRQKHDAHSSRQRFSPRRPRSGWSQPNRDRVARLIEQGLMTEAGQAAIDRAKANGTWHGTAGRPTPS